MWLKLEAPMCIFRSLVVWVHGRPRLGVERCFHPSVMNFLVFRWPGERLASAVVSAGGQVGAHQQGTRKTFVNALSFFFTDFLHRAADRL